jgi:hypothetical protein
LNKPKRKRREKNDDEKTAGNMKGIGYGYK